MPAEPIVVQVQGLSAPFLAGRTCVLQFERACLDVGVLPGRPRHLRIGPAQVWIVRSDLGLGPSGSDLADLGSDSGEPTQIRPSFGRKVAQERELCLTPIGVA